MKALRILVSLLIPASALIASACTNPLSSLLGGGSSSSSSSSTSTTDTFTGSLAPSGSVGFTFSVASAGTVAVTLASITPAANGPLGLGIGPVANGTCTIVNSTSGATASGTAQLSAMENAGNYCVRVSDAGTLSTTSTVIVAVMHP